MPSNSDNRPRVGGAWLRKVPRNRVVGALAAVAVCELAFWFLAVRPLADQELEQQQLLASLAQQVQQRQASVERLRAASAAIHEAQGEGDELLDELTFDRQTTFSELLTELGRAAKEAGVEVRETNYQSDTIDGNERYGMVSISANFRGEYENLVKLLNLLDHSEKFLIVERLGAAPREEGGLQITMRVDAFVRNL
ncbi:MAG: type 4a pilus biogenesis protein PilO [Acidobacteria bacterium]|nr:type 4a pilus biogenesis protein PilO [Acidobacteriota bacterium]